MAIFSGKIVTAHYIDTEYSMIELIYEGADGNLHSHALRSDPNNPEFQALLADGWDEEKLFEGTAEYKRRSSAAHNIEVNRAARLLIKEMYGYSEDEEELEPVDQNFSWDYFFDEMNNNKDEIFRFKIWAFESEKMKNVDQETKKKLRKAANILEAIKIYEAIS